MSPEKFLVLLERCLQLIETVPPERRGMLIEVAAQCLRLAEENMAPARRRAWPSDLLLRLLVRPADRPVQLQGQHVQPDEDQNPDKPKGAEHTAR